MNDHDADLDALAERLTDPTAPLRGIGAPLVGDEASAAGRAFLVSQYGSDDAIADAIKRGRPRAGSERGGGSPTVRARITDADFAAFKELERRTGKRQSELVREAIHRLLVAEKMVG